MPARTQVVGESDADDTEALDTVGENPLFGHSRESNLPGTRHRHEFVAKDGLPGPGVRLMVAIAALVLVAVVVPLVATSTQSPNSSGLSTHPAWRLVGNITRPSWQVGSSTGASPFLVTCPSALTCYAIGTSADTVECHLGHGATSGVRSHQRRRSELAGVDHH